MDIHKLKDFFQGFIFSKKGTNSFQVNQFTFSNAIQIFNFLFKNNKIINGIDLLKLKKLFSLKKDKFVNMICNNAKKMLNIK